MANSIFYSSSFTYSFRVVRVLGLGLALCFTQVLLGQQTRVVSSAPNLYRAVRTGDMALVRARLQAGDNPNARDADGRTPLIVAVRYGKVAAVRALLAAGANVDARDVNGITALLEAADKGRPKSARVLINAGADLNIGSRGLGTALEAAQRAGHNDIVAMLRQAGARSSGHSVGDTVCVRPWGGDGYCGTVESVNKNQYALRVTGLVGCGGGCSAKPECSAGREVGGPDGIKVGDTVNTVSWCLTQTGVRR
jgi:uncharacterized protein